MQGGLISCSTSNETENYDMGTLLDELSQEKKKFCCVVAALRFLGGRWHVPSKFFNPCQNICSPLFVKLKICISNQLFPNRKNKKLKKCRGAKAVQKVMMIQNQLRIWKAGYVYRVSYIWHRPIKSAKPKTQKFKGHHGFFYCPLWFFFIHPAHDVRVTLLRHRFSVFKLFQHPYNVVSTSIQRRSNVVC